MDVRSKLNSLRNIFKY